MEKLIFFSLIFVVISTLFFISVSSYESNQVSFPKQTHSYTKAICTKDNYCQDFEIFCENTNVIGIKFTGSAVQFSSEWKDPRDEKIISSFCD